jgi:hypothetical protein
MRLPRAEDEVVIFIDVDGELVRAEGVIQRVTLRQGVDMLRGQFIPLNHRMSGEITVSLRVMAPGHELADPSQPETIEVVNMGGDVVQTIILPPERRE